MMMAVFEAVTSQEQRDALKKSSKDAEAWLYEDGHDASFVETYKSEVKKNSPSLVLIGSFSI